MKKVLYVVIILALLAIGYSMINSKGDGPKAKKPGKTTPAPKVHTGEEPFRIGDGRLANHPWLRFDGTYKMTDAGGKNAQYMRFYPEGNVTLITGAETPGGIDLRGFMAQDTPNNGPNEVRNSLIEVRGDSLLFTTKSMKGEIDYKGTISAAGKNKLSFLKHSRINGRKGRFEYTFVAD